MLNLSTMHLTVRARVRNGRLVVDEPTDLPEGTEVELASTHDDELDDVDRAQLHAALDQAATQLTTGNWVSGDDVIRRLRANAWIGA